MQVSSSDLQTFLVLLVAATHRNSEVYGKFLFSKEASCIARACNQTLKKMFTILALSFLLIIVTGFTFRFMT